VKAGGAVRVVIVETRDDEALIVGELRRLEVEPTWAVADTGAGLLDQLTTRSDVLICDASVPGLPPARVLTVLRERGDPTPVIVVSDSHDVDAAVETMRLGAADYVRKDRLDAIGPSVERLLDERRGLEAPGDAQSPPDRRGLLERLVTAQEEERRRIAADIHGDALQGVAALSMRLEALVTVHPELKNDEHYLSLRDGVRDTTTRLRRLMFELHPRELETVGMIAALREHLHELGKTAGAPEYDLRFGVFREPAANIRTVLYRIVQEAIANARKHSGARHVTVLLDERDGGFFARVEDDGVGFPASESAGAQSGRAGLRSMRERAELAGGWLRIGSVVGRGTAIEAWVPDAAVRDPSPGRRRT
jgi:signal transduction histidine kinase